MTCCTWWSGPCPGRTRRWTRVFGWQFSHYSSWDVAESFSVELWTVRLSGDVAESFSIELQTVKISWDVAESFLIELRTVKISRKQNA